MPGHQIPVDIKYETLETTGTIDRIVELFWPDRKFETVVVDLKNYGRAPSQPFESNVMQVPAYRDCCHPGPGFDAGYVFYCPDVGDHLVFRIDDPEPIAPRAEAFFREVEKCIESRTFPPRLPYSDHRCQWCPFFNECWGGILK